MTDKTLKMRGMLLNDGGYQAMQAGRLEEAQTLFARSLTIARSIADWEGEVIALENIYLAHRAGRQYAQALATLEEIIDALFRAEQFDRVEVYWLEIAQAVQDLAQFQVDVGEFFIVRQSHQDEDVARWVQNPRREQLHVLIVEEAQDVLEVIAHTPQDQWLPFIDKITQRIENNLQTLGVSKLSDLTGPG